ncbi:super-infection exclusion protein B [Faecousia sp.]|uniref:super-infection exclusion protein B n=1 Tax=Eubacteriales TaxID=186802 RepID=UPI002A8EC4E9|nr:super-infection exclusion protein B [Candidatus Faecousia sp.]
MEWITKLIDLLKVPLKVLLPSAWLFSSAMTLFPDRWLEKLGLLEWKNEHLFAFGLILIITSCLILVYSFIYTKSKITHLISKLFLNRNTMKKFSSMSDVEKAIILKLYHSPAFTCELDYGQPVIKGLVARNYLYGGGQQLVRTSLYSTALPVKLTLQPFVYQALDYYKEKLSREIEKTEKKIAKTKRESKLSKLNYKLYELKDCYEAYFDENLFKE